MKKFFTILILTFILAAPVFSNYWIVNIDLEDEILAFEDPGVYTLPDCETVITITFEGTHIILEWDEESNCEFTASCGIYNEDAELIQMLIPEYYPGRYKFKYATD